jgi:hypothetical protein
MRSAFNHYVFVPGERIDVFAPSPAVALVNSRTAGTPSRVIGLENNLFPDYFIALGWESLYGVDAVRSGYYLDLAGAFNLARVFDWGGGTAEEDVPRLLPGHDLMNVTHYLADTRSPPGHEIPGLKWVGQRDLDVYASPTAWPRAFFTDRLEVYDQVSNFADLARAGDGRPFAAVQASEKDVPALPADLGRRAIRAATEYRLTANTTSFAIDAPGPGIAVLTEAFYADDFQVTIDGRPARYFRVNHAFKGVVIDRPGRHEISFAYWPEHFTLALMLGALGMLSLAAWACWLWRTGGKKSSIQTPIPA